MTAAALGAYPPLEGTLRPLSLALGGLALAFLAAGLAGRWTAPVATGLTLLGAQYAVLFSAGPEAVDEWTPFYAAGFLLSAELSFWSTEPRVPAWSDLEVVLRRLGTVLGACLGAAGSRRSSSSRPALLSATASSPRPPGSPPRWRRSLSWAPSSDSCADLAV